MATTGSTLFNLLVILISVLLVLAGSQWQLGTER